MKTLNRLFALIVTCCTLLGCSKPLVTEILVGIDITDDSIQWPELDDLVAGFDLSDNPWNGAIFSLSMIEDVPYTQFKQCRLAPQNSLSGNSLRRKAEVTKFKTACDSMLSTARMRAELEKRHSAIYLPFAQNLRRLANSSADIKKCVFFSDMLENTNHFSVYRAKDHDPQAVQSLLESLEPLPSDLSGIKVYLVFQPTSPRTAELFHLMSHFYKHWLEEKGAQVTISGSLNFE